MAKVACGIEYTVTNFVPVRELDKKIVPKHY